jgi:hypothetical protein
MPRDPGGPATGFSPRLWTWRASASRAVFAASSWWESTTNVVTTTPRTSEANTVASAAK